jgi:hypothetical protein
LHISFPKNCTFRLRDYNRANIKVTGAGNIAGIAAICTGDNITISGCKNYGKITGATGNNGGIVASVIGVNVDKTAITSCVNYGDMSIASAAASATGGITGRATNPAGVDIKWCSNRGKITISANSTAGTGGIIGALAGNSSVRECFNLGDIETFTNTGGISGLINNKEAIYNCYNKGTITYATTTAVNNGGIAGNMTNIRTFDPGAPVEYCYNAGEAKRGQSGDRYAAIAASNNLVGLTDLKGVKQCFYETGKGYFGGIGGSITPGDVASQAEGKTAVEMMTGTPYSINWNTDVWQFTSGMYPTLKNNPE